MFELFIEREVSAETTSIAYMVFNEKNSSEYTIFQLFTMVLKLKNNFIAPKSLLFYRMKNSNRISSILSQEKNGLINVTKNKHRK